MSTLKRCLKLSLRGLLREWHAGELRVLIAALVVAVAGVTAVDFFTDRVERAMLMQASELMAADLVLHSPQPITEVIEERARALGLRTTRTLSFRSVVLVGERLELAEVKAVAEGYPLYGTLRLAPLPFAADEATDEVPPRGTAWPDARLLGKLAIGVADDLQLGERTLKVDAVLSYEPDRGGDLFNIAPRLMVHYDDVASTGLIQPGSRVTYALMTAGPLPQVEAFQRAVQPELADDQHFHEVREGRPELRLALERAEQFLGLAALVSVLLAGAAIALSARRYAARRFDAAALMRCLGATQALITGVFSIQVLVLGLLASLLGCALGFIAQLVLVNTFSELLLAELPIPSLTPIGTGLATGIITLAGFALPPMLRLKDVSPIRVMRKELGGVAPGAVTAYSCAFCALAVLAWWHAGDTRLAAYVLGGAIAALAVLAGAAALLVWLLRRLRTRVGTAWRFGLANLSRRARGSVLQIVAFGLGFTMLLLLSIVRGDILDEWQRNLPADAPNYFLVNVQPADVQAMRRFMSSRSVNAPTLYPMIRGRLQTIDGRAVSGADYEDPRAKRLATRQFNLSWSDEPSPGNRIIAGRWWSDSADDAAEFSVEIGLAETLGIELGDRLRFSVAGEPVDGRVTSLRAVEWDSFNVNFFVVAPRALLESQPTTYISSFYLPTEDRDTLIELVRSFPSVTVLDVAALLDKVREIMERAVVGVEYVFLFTLLAGVVVLVAAVQSTMDERRFETAIIRTLGGRKALLWKGLLAEFVTLGVAAGLIAAMVSTAVGVVVAEEIFELSYRGDPVLWLVGVLVGGAGVGLAGIASARGAVTQSPLATLRAL